MHCPHKRVRPASGVPLKAQRPVKLCGYIHQASTLASEYHCKDFDWREHAARMRILLQSQRASARLLQTDKDATVSPAAADVDSLSWESFYASHSTARFFKARRYLLLQFPYLLSAKSSIHVCEIGCGYGSSIIPILKHVPSCTSTVCDVSPTSIAQLHSIASDLGIVGQRLRACVADATDPAAAAEFSSWHADALLLIFTLSAILPERMTNALKNAYHALKPGGRLLFRDHGLYDMVQLRIPPEQMIGENVYRRADGTVSVFFSQETLCSLMQSAGFICSECEYICVINKNRKDDKELKRVFLHGVFERPLNS